MGGGSLRRATSGGNPLRAEARGVPTSGRLPVRGIDQRPALVRLRREILARRAGIGVARRPMARRRSRPRPAVGSAKIVGVRRAADMLGHARSIERYRLVRRGGRRTRLDCARLRRRRHARTRAGRQILLRYRGVARLEIGQRGCADRPGMAPGGRGSSAKPSAALSPKVDTFSGKSAPHTPGPRIALIRTMPAPSLTVPALRHSTSASSRHGSRSANMLPPLQPASTPRIPRTPEPTRYQRTPHAMAGRMRWTLLTTLQRFAAARGRWRGHRAMVKKKQARIEYRA